MTDGWGRDYSPAPAPAKRSFVTLLVWAVVMVIAFIGVTSWLNNRDDVAPPEAPPTAADIRADDVEELPRHDPALNADGRAVAAPVGDWDVAVLETDRQATEDWTAEQMDVGFDAAFVMTTVYVKYNGEAPVAFTDELGWDFASQHGTNRGHNPWEDWCPGWSNNALGVGVMLPGEARVVRICVPVARQDAAGLEMHVSQDPYNFTGPKRIFGLPSDGVVYPAPEDVSADLPYTLALEHAQDTGEYRGETYSPVQSWVAEVLGDNWVRVAAIFDVERSPLPAEGYGFDPEARGPSGQDYFPTRCPEAEQDNANDDRAPRIQVCWEVFETDSRELLAVFTDERGTGDWLVLRVPAAGEPPPS